MVNASDDKDSGSLTETVRYLSPRIRTTGTRASLDTAKLRLDWPQAPRKLQSVTVIVYVTPAVNTPFGITVGGLKTNRFSLSSAAAVAAAFVVESSPAMEK